MFSIFADSIMIATRCDERKRRDKPDSWDEATETRRHRNWLHPFRR